MGNTPQIIAHLTENIRPQIHPDFLFQFRHSHVHAAGSHRADRSGQFLDIVKHGAPIHRSPRNLLHIRRHKVGRSARTFGRINFEQGRLFLISQAHVHGRILRFEGGADISHAELVQTRPDPGLQWIDGQPAGIQFPLLHFDAQALLHFPEE